LFLENQLATFNRSSSFFTLAINCTPIGKPLSEIPAGIDIAGTPLILAHTVKKSFSSNTPSVFKYSSYVGVSWKQVGVIIISTSDSNTLLKSFFYELTNFL
jgi:hypothetical protein